MSPDKKKFWMWLCVGGTLAVIAVIWLASIRYNISTTIIETAQSKQKSIEAFGDFEKNLTKQMEDLQNQFNAPAEISTSTATSTE